MNGWLTAATVIAALTCGIHVVAGGREIARPLLDSALKPVPKYTNYFCWHLVTIMLAGLAVAFGLVTWGEGGRMLGLFAVGCAALSALLNLSLIVRYRQNPLHLPQWMLFAPMTVCGAVGLWA